MNPDGFTIHEKEVSVTAFRRKPSVVYEFIDTPGNVVIFTRRKKRECVIMSIETYARWTRDSERLMAEIDSLVKQFHRQRKKTSGVSLYAMTKYGSLNENDTEE